MTLFKYGHDSLRSMRAAVHDFESARSLIGRVCRKFRSKQELGALNTWYCQLPDIATQELDAWFGKWNCVVRFGSDGYVRSMPHPFSELSIDNYIYCFHGPQPIPRRAPDYILSFSFQSGKKSLYVSSSDAAVMFRLLHEIQKAALVDEFRVNGNSDLYSATCSSERVQLDIPGVRYLPGDRDCVPLAVQIVDKNGDVFIENEVLDFISGLTMPLSFEASAQLDRGGYRNAAIALNKLHRTWIGTFYVKVDDLLRQCNTTRSSRFPLIAEYIEDAWYSHDIPELQVDFVRDSNGAFFLELMSVNGVEFLRGVAEMIPLRFEEWNGEFCERWGW